MHAAAGFFENGAPKKDGAGERNQAEDGAEKIIPAVNKSVLQAEIENGEILSHGADPLEFSDRAIVDSGKNNERANRADERHAHVRLGVPNVALAYRENRSRRRR